jgi:hypothetical protein
MAQRETDPAEKAALENLARSYLRLAEQAERNDEGYKAAPKDDRDQPRERDTRATDKKPDCQ